MSLLRNALVDLSGISSIEVDIQEYLAPRAEGRAKKMAVKPDAIDDFQDHSIDTTKWAVTGAVTEGAFLGIDALLATDPTTPDWDACGIIYKPPISAQVGRMVISRAIAEHPVEFMFCLQEYDFTVDSVVTPTTWTLKYKTTPQDLRNSMGMIWRAGSLYFFEGGQPGNEELVSEAPWRGSKSGEIYPLQIAFVFTATGWDIWAHLPGVWTAAKLVKSYTRPGGTHNANGYSLCVNKYTADDTLAFYDPALNFKANVVLQGARIVAAQSGDVVHPSSLVVGSNAGINAGLPGTILVRFPDLGGTLYTPAQVAQIAQTLTGKNLYPVDFELAGDVTLEHPTRITIDDGGLPIEETAEAE